MRGWRLHRYIERKRYLVFCRKMLRRKIRAEQKRRRRDGNQFKLDRDEFEYAVLANSKGFQNPEGVYGDFQSGDLIIKMPQVMDFEKNYSKSAKIFEIFRRALLCRKRIAYIDFSQMKEISPACITVFCCYADLWKRYSQSHRLQACTWTWCPGILKQFKEIGFFEILNLKVPECGEEERGERSFMGLRRYFVDSMELESVGKEIKVIRNEIENFVGRTLNRLVMYQSVSEAITNIYQHAYSSTTQSLSKKWWLSVSYDKKNAELGIIVFDHGLGIPKTMEDSSKFRKYRDIFLKMKTKWSEAKRLELAFERTRNRYGRLRPKLEGRGNGCGDIIELISNSRYGREGSSLFVVSSKAQYSYIDTDVGRRGVASANNVSLQGTLIEWKIKL